MVGIDVIKCEDWMETQQFEFVAFKKTNEPQKEKTPRQIVESFHLSTVPASYTCHFATYNIGKKQVTHVIPSIVWRNVYFDYQKEYPNSTIAEEALKDQLCDT
jgi:hypothetical protein